jgi:hypothetical protein
VTSSLAAVLAISFQGFECARTLATVRDPELEIRVPALEKAFKALV